jgi:hypothetical protein
MIAIIAVFCSLSSPEKCHVSNRKPVKTFEDIASLIADA